MTDLEPTPHDAETRLPGLLRDVTRGRVVVPAAVDDHLRRRIRARFAMITEQRRWRRAGLRAAAALALTATLGLLMTRQTIQARGPADVDRNGRVNILDAALLDRRLANGEATPARLDLNGDGRVDERDVALIAERSVDLDETGRPEVG